MTWRHSRRPRRSKRSAMLIKLNHTSTKPEAPRQHRTPQKHRPDRYLQQRGHAALDAHGQDGTHHETPLEMFANAEGRVAELLTIQPNTGYELPFLLAEDAAAV